MNPATMFGSDLDPDEPVDRPLDLLDRWLSRVDGITVGRSGPPRRAPGPRVGDLAEGDGGDTPEGADATTTPLMALATIDVDGYPRVRHVLLSAYDRGRLHFHTDHRTAKAAELAANPRAGATIVWPDIPRQLSVTGTVEPESPEEQALAFARRTRYLQLLAWVNSPELARRSAGERARVWAGFDASHPALEPPPTWVGYVLVAERISFWRGGADGPSQRIACRRTEAGWQSERLPG